MSKEIENAEVLSTETVEETSTGKNGKKEEPAKSKSQAKRDARKAAAKAAKTKKNVEKIVGWIIGVAIAGVVIAAIVLGIIQSANTITASGNYSEGLTAEGCVSGADLTKVTDLGLESLVVPASEIEYTDEEVESDMDSVRENAKYYDSDSSLEVKDGDTINLDYVGTVDGVEFSGGSTNGSGTTLTIGSGKYVDDFEQQLIGSHPGDEVTVTVTFPEDYSETDTTLNGAEAVFACTINSIQVTPELTDEFVAENYGELASTVDELYAYAKETGSNSKLYNYLSDYITDNAQATGYPSSYAKHLQSLLKYNDEQTYNYYNSYYSSYLGVNLYSSFEDYTGKSEEEYNKELKSKAKDQAALDLTYEYYFKKFGLEITEDIYNETVSAFGSADTYGAAYINQVCMKYAVIYYLADHVTIQ